MSASAILELGLALLILGGGVYLYRRHDKSDRYGSQSGVLLIVIGIIVAIHALGLHKYRPSASDAAMIRTHKR